MPPVFPKGGAPPLLPTRIVMITGVSRGLGQAMAIGLAEAGADIAGLDVISLEETQGLVEGLGRRFLALGLPERGLQVTGNIKFDLELDVNLRARAAALRNDFAARNRPVLLAGSTHRGEDEQILAAFARVRQRFDKCLLVLVPRHPERFDAVYELCAGAGWRVLR